MMEVDGGNRRKVNPLTLDLPEGFLPWAQKQPEPLATFFSLIHSIARQIPPEEYPFASKSSFRFLFVRELHPLLDDPINAEIGSSFEKELKLTVTDCLTARVYSGPARKIAERGFDETFRTCREFAIGMYYVSTPAI